VSNLSSEIYAIRRTRGHRKYHRMWTRQKQLSILHCDSDIFSN